MRYRIVQHIGGKFVRTEPPDIFAWAKAAGFKVVRLNSNPGQRTELQGQPIFANLYGPMWDGNAIRYEDSRANDILSA